MNANQLKALVIENNKNYYENTLMPAIIEAAKKGESHICVDIEAKHYAYVEKKLKENSIHINNTRADEKPYTISWY